jgi:GDPmannose 4,6-dehydratase
MWAMLQQDTPDDYVIATGETHSVREFLDIGFGYVGLDAEDYVVQDPSLFRPAECELAAREHCEGGETTGLEIRTDF